MNIENMKMLITKSGAELQTGLTDDEINEIERVFGAPMPADFKEMLHHFLPIGNMFYDWQKPQNVHDDFYRDLENVIRFDISNNNFWCPLFGDKPQSIDESVAKAMAAIHNAPPLFPIYSHRCAARSASRDKSVVISLYQFTDSAVYGVGIEDYLMREFGNQDNVSMIENVHVPFWSECLEL